MAKTMVFEAKIKPWGHSIGVTLPKKELAELGLRPGDTVEIEVRRKASIWDLHGTLPDIEERAGMTIGEIVREAKENWSKWE